MPANALAVASVTALLKDLLNDGLINKNVDSLFNFQITAQPPDRISAGSDGEDINRLNLFLYRVTHNTGWANQRLPARNGAGDRVDNPYLALDLHYMLSAFATDDLNAEILLGFGMQVLHENPVLTRDGIRTGLGAGGPLSGALLGPGFQQLSATALAEQIEQVKISPFQVSLDDLSKLWSAMNTPLRMSALYQASVVLIESETSTRSSLPVQERAVFVRQLAGPTIARLLSQAAGGTEASASRQITMTDELVLEGSGLRGEVTVVAIGRGHSTPIEAGDRRVVVGLPPGVRPGVNGVQVEHHIAKLPPSTQLMPGETSNVVAFVLHPTVASIDVLQAALEDANVATGPVAGRIRITFAHQVGSAQRTEVLLNELNPPANRPAFAYTFVAAPVPDPAPETVTAREFPIRFVEQLTFLVRARVDGAASALTLAGGAFTGPTVAVAPAP